MTGTRQVTLRIKDSNKDILHENGASIASKTQDIIMEAVKDLILQDLHDTFDATNCASWIFFIRKSSHHDSAYHEDFPMIAGMDWLVKKKCFKSKLKILNITTHQTRDSYYDQIQKHVIVTKRKACYL